LSFRTFQLIFKLYKWPENVTQHERTVSMKIKNEIIFSIDKAEK
jgi:hypothetical protein